MSGRFLKSKMFYEVAGINYLVSMNGSENVCWKFYKISSGAGGCRIEELRS